MFIEQLSFNFNKPQNAESSFYYRASWQIKAVARRHNIPLSQAAIVAGELRLPVGGIR